MSLKRTIQLNVNCGSALSGHLLTGSLVDALVYLCYYIIYCYGLRLSSGSLLGSGISLCCWLYSVFSCGLCSGLPSSLGSLSRAALTSAVLPALTSTGFSGFAATGLAAVVPADFTAVSAFAVVVVVVFFCLGMIVIPFNYPMARLHDAPCHSIYLS